MLSLVACEGEHAALGGPVLVDTSQPASAGSIVVPIGTQAQSGKVDLLFMIDNSASMGDKQELLRRSVPDLVRRLVAPNCVDPRERRRSKRKRLVRVRIARVRARDGPPRRDPDVIARNRGGDVCPEHNPRTNDRAHLVNLGPNGTPLPDAADGILRFGPGGITDPQVLESDITALVAGVGTDGCGLEAQLESWYRFLVEPDPYDDVVVTTASPRSSEPMPPS